MGGCCLKDIRKNNGIDIAVGKATGLSGLECFARDPNSDKCFLQPPSCHLVTLLYFCISLLLYFCISVFLPKNPTVVNAFYNQSFATWSVVGHPALESKTGRISGAVDGSFVVKIRQIISFSSKAEQNWSWMRPLLRCHLEIPKNC